MNKLIIIRGTLGVGKSTISKILSKKLNSEYLSLDDIIDDNNLAESDGSLSLNTFLKANDIIQSLTNKNNNTYIIDGCFYYQKQIDDLKKIFNNDVIIFTLIANVEACIVRDSKRDKVYGEDSAKYVHMITTKIKAGHEINNENLTIEETVNKILNEI